MTSTFIKQLAIALYEAAAGKSAEEIGRIAVRALDILRRRRLLSRSHELFEALEHARNQREAAVTARIVSRHALPRAHVDRIRTALSARYQRDIRIEELTDQSIIGGFRVQVADALIDATINYQLKMLSRRFARDAA